MSAFDVIVQPLTYTFIIYCDIFAFITHCGVTNLILFHSASSFNVALYVGLPLHNLIHLHNGFKKCSSLLTYSSVN